MGRIQHHAIVATTWDDSMVTKIKKFISESPLKHLFSVGPVAINGYVSVVMFPDGSKEGWDDSDVGDAERNKSIVLLEDGYSEWVEVSFGDDGHKIERGNCER